MKLIYFIRPVDCEGPVKIGCSVMPETRLKTMSAWSPIMLEIAATFPGGHDIEVALHHRFSHLSLHGEWFGVDRDLLALIDDVRAGKISAIEAAPAGSATARQIAGIKSAIAQKVGNVEKRVFGHRMSLGEGRPEHIRRIMERFTDPSLDTPSPEEQRLLAAYVAELRSLPPFRGELEARWRAWTEYRDGPLGFSAPARQEAA